MDKKKFLLPASLFLFHQAEAGNMPLNEPLLPDSTNQPELDSLKVLSGLMLDYGVFRNTYATPTFYTWTTEEQINLLRENKQLLTKSKSEEKGYSLFDKILQDKQYEGNKAAQLLLDERFKKKRFAWTSSWPTACGWENETYGQHLLEVKLKDDAIIAYIYYSNQKNQERRIWFYDLKMKRVSEQTVLENPERLAGVYFQHISGKTKKIRNKQKGRRYSTFYIPNYTQFKVEAENTYREFVLMNEQMIASWSYGTAAVQQKIQKEINDLKRVQQFLDENYDSSQEMSWTDITAKWDEPRDRTTFQNNQKYLELMTRFYCAVAFLNKKYTFHPAQIKKIIEELEASMKAWKEPIKSGK